MRAPPRGLVERHTRAPGKEGTHPGESARSWSLNREQRTTMQGRLAMSGVIPEIVQANGGGNVGVDVGVGGGGGGGGGGVEVAAEPMSIVRPELIVTAGGVLGVSVPEVM